jgi:hypothetical protein
MVGPIRPGKLYVCEVGGPEFARLLAGPYDNEAEAMAAAGAIEAEHPEFLARTDIWRCPVPESDVGLIVLPLGPVGYSLSPLPLA